MGRTFIRQETQVGQSDTYDDTIAAGIAALQTAASDLQFDLNAMRSQGKRAIFADAAGNWYADIPTVNGKKRGISALNTDLDDVEIHKFLFRTDVLTDLTVPAAQNWQILSVSGTEAPTVVAAVALTVEGAVVAQSALNGAGFDVAELITIAGQNAIRPKNLLEVRDATTGQRIQSSGRDVFGLLQYESTGVDGAAFNDASAGNRVKISYVRLAAGLSTLEACPVVDIATKSLNYAYARRLSYDSLPEDVFIGSAAFVDQSAATDVTLDRAIDNQSGAATQAQDIDWRVSDTFTLDFQDSTGGRNLVRIAPNVAGDLVSFDVDDFTVTSANNETHTNGAKFDTGGTEIDVGVVAGTISTTGAADLRVLGAGELFLDDGNQTGSTWAQTSGIKLSDTTAEWDALEAAYGGEFSILKYLTLAKNASRSKTVAVLTANVSANTNITFPTNLDAALGDYSAVTFLTGVDIYLNGVLMRNGADASANHDVYPGTTPANGDLKFEFNVKAGAKPDVITMIIW